MNLGSIFRVLVLSGGLCLLNCRQTQMKGLDPVDDLAAYLNSKEGILYVLPRYEQRVLGMIKAESIGEGVYRVDRIPIHDRFFSIQFTVRAVSSPYYFMLYSGRDYPPLPTVPDTTCISLRAYANSECGKIHSPFVSECLGTPADKRHLGRSMLLEVDRWRSCQAGDDLCIELLSKVGEVTYFQYPACSDTLITIENLYQYQCLDWSKWP